MSENSAYRDISLLKHQLPANVFEKQPTRDLLGVKRPISEPSLPNILAELREMQRLRIEDKSLIDDLRRQNDRLKSMLLRYNRALQKYLDLL
ncbi:hypothetical protein N7537_001514 [Penicillium hordei]|uniref:Uncharacterized protein n=1 Tax=Penicillium hordei TaxID=40994 RepID=A0AAD6EFN7_9EURO|nr:uncharacterized protein N7537_001514 [Penicillium hordei]KAJ5616400.1 hypothetical protein N7537_001514 [Penicillium hordei]